MLPGRHLAGGLQSGCTVNLTGAQYKMQNQSHILLKIPLKDKKKENADEKNNRRLFLCPFSASGSNAPGSRRGSGAIRGGGCFDGCGFRKSAVRKKRGYLYGYGQHYENHDLYPGTGACVHGRYADGICLCRQHAEGKAGHPKGRAIYRGGSAVFSDAGIPQRYGSGIGGICGEGVSDRRAERKRHGGIHRGRKQESRGCVCGVDESKGDGTGL